jgi:mono/diheme cytochrome c family protein
MSIRHAGITGLALLTGLVQSGCSPRPAGEEAAPSKVDTVVTRRDTVPSRTDTTVVQPDTASPRRDTVKAGADSTAQPGAGQGASFSQIEYEGWRQYSVNCARCHGQDVLPNPVAANLLISAAPGGPMASEQEFVRVVSEGRPDRGMPAFKSILTPDQSKATYAYVKGRAEKRLPPGRPAPPA